MVGSASQYIENENLLARTCGVHTGTSSVGFRNDNWITGTAYVTHWTWSTPRTDTTFFTSSFYACPFLYDRR